MKPEKGFLHVGAVWSWYDKRPFSVLYAESQLLLSRNIFDALRPFKTAQLAQQDLYQVFYIFHSCICLNHLPASASVVHLHYLIMVAV